MYRMDWTDERIQERFDSIDHRFDEVGRRFDEVDRRFVEVDRRFDKVDAELRRVNDRIDGVHQMMHRTMLQLGGGMLVTLALGLAGAIVTH